MKPFLVKTCATILPLATLIACGSDTTGITNDPIVGSYFATEFVTTGSFGQINQLVEGSTLNINLLNNHRTTGQLHLVATAASPAFDGDMTGTWAHTGNTVTFSQDADTFIRDFDFTVTDPIGGTQLAADHTFAGVNIKLTLTRGAVID
jgi:hypothetical protein